MKIDTTTWLCGSPPNRGQFQQFPGRFLYNLKRTYPDLMQPRTLVLFAGAVKFGQTVDSNPEANPLILAEFDAIPKEVGTFASVLADPPYADHWQGQWHGALPKPKHILRVASEFCEPGGLIGILHIIIIPAYKVYGVERIALHPVLTGPNNAIRVFNVFRKKEDQ